MSGLGEEVVGAVLLIGQVTLGEEKGKRALHCSVLEEHRQHSLDNIVHCTRELTVVVLGVRFIVQVVLQETTLSDIFAKQTVYKLIPTLGAVF